MKLFIVHCIDAEGPLYESLEATFDRIKNAFGITIQPSYNNLKKLQNKEIPHSGKEDAIANMVSPDLLDYNDTWIKIDKMLDDITSDKFRKEVLDSFGGGWVYNWFCLDHVGFIGRNPRRRDLGFHKIFDHYISYNKKNNIKRDLVQWHFHPLSLIKDAHRCGTSYVNSPLPFEILARKIIDRKWFPAVFRPGFHTERSDSNWFLEQWIPFDYANQATKGVPTDQPDLENGKLGDWRRAPKEWKAYHPDHDDYQKEGRCRRWIARCLNMRARLRQITIEDMRDGFKRAMSGKPTIIAFTNHDFRNMKLEINRIRNMIQKVSKEFPEVKFKYADAIEAMRGFTNNYDNRNPDFKIHFHKNKNSTILNIKSKNDIFGPQPFFALKTKAKEYFWDNLNFQSKNEWSYTFDFDTFNIKELEKIGIASNTKNGVSEILVIDVDSKKISKNILNNKDYS